MAAKRNERGREASQNDTPDAVRAAAADADADGGTRSELDQGNGAPAADAAEGDGDAGAVLQQEIAGLRDQLLRLAADFDNYRKRASREQQEVRDYGTSNVLNEILPVLDNLDRALAHSDGDKSPVVAGIRLVVKQFHDVLSRFGVTSFTSVGVPFDPERHEAVAQLPTSEHKPGTIVEELQKGYMLRDRLLRPARVVVAAAPGERAAESAD
jgi:molecular chaperone GrpE